MGIGLEKSVDVAVRDSMQGGQNESGWVGTGEYLTFAHWSIVKIKLTNKGLI